MSSSSEVATQVLAHGSAARLSVSSAVDEGRFPPGTLLAQRYRVSSRLGKGGMGEVYKATDLLVGQTVALKFLPEELAASESMLERFRNEVRLARQVSHPNVCRVYDLGEADGHLFLSMEFIDGEDLASLVRRIGHLPPLKAREVAHKLCAGLAAAHGKGVLHRDFKPANIMLDGRGQVLITDFGLAAAHGGVAAGDIGSGTPAYMAPEQLSGSEVTPRSDIYALGLVLYEIFTGRHPFEASSREELIAKQAAGPPPMKDVDPAVEKAIARCLEIDPKRRPATALALANAMPGGDPLQAALAAGETPSPAMVAAAGETAAMNPKLALVCLAALLAGIVVVAEVAGKGWAFSRAAAEVSPEVMAQKARDTLAHIGYTGKPHAEAWGYALDGGRLDRLAGVPHEEAWRRIADARPPAISFWYRQSPSRLLPDHFSNRHVSANDPPYDTYTMRTIRLDPQGHLSRLLALPSAVDTPRENAAPYDWKRLFEAAGLDMARFAPATPRLTPFSAVDERGAWVEQGSAAPLRIEAAAWHGQPVSFSETDEAPAASGAAVQARFVRFDMAQLLFQVFMILTEAILAWNNLRLARGDARGALRVGGAVASLSFLSYVLLTQHAMDFGEYRSLMQGGANALLDGAQMAAAYLAFEPFIRRRWPDVLISWTRGLSGAGRDPLVGRHLLLGLAAGVGITAVYKAHDLLYGPASMGARSVDLFAADNTGHVLGELAYSVSGAVSDACWAAFLVFVFAVVVRNRWLAAGLASLLWAYVQASGSAYPLITGALWVAAFGVLYLLLFRCGLLACFAYACVGEVAMATPLTLDNSAWYFGASVAGMVALAAAGYFAFRTAVAGQAVLKAD